MVASTRRRSSSRGRRAGRDVGAVVGTPSPNRSKSRGRVVSRSSDDNTGTEDDKNDRGGGIPARKAMTGKAVAKDESRMGKVVTRVGWGVVMVAGFLLILYSGHLWVCGLIALLEVALFRELVRVRYAGNLDIVKDNIPMFRMTQWMWFGVGIFYTYSDFISSMIVNNTKLQEQWGWVSKFTGVATFSMYVTTFLVSVWTLQRNHVKFQLNQLCWTLCVLFLTIGQLKYIMHNVYNGLFWFTYPVLLVVVNDIMAYVCGMSFGRKFINREFLKLSPNKTWEGFIGGGVCTIFIGCLLARFLAQFKWMTCPVDTPVFFPGPLDCEVEPIFLPSYQALPAQVFELIPTGIVRLIPGVTEFCQHGSLFDDIRPCVSGAKLAHDHFELNFTILPIQLHAIPLSIFASVVAPFGGFFASGIKRAYGIKDFDSIIPGHGGVMDRMDCQFLMSLCTWVHYNAFVKMVGVSVPKLIFLYKALPESAQQEFLEKVKNM